MPETLTPPELDTPEISRALVLSTAHLPSSLAGPITELEGLGVEAIVEPTRYGWRLFVGCDEPDPSGYGRLGQAVMAARYLHCRWIEFDRDGEEQTNLPRWDDSGNLRPRSCPVHAGTVTP